jgi:hypothetical protein
LNEKKKRWASAKIAEINKKYVQEQPAMVKKAIKADNYAPIEVD